MCNPVDTALLTSWVCSSVCPARARHRLTDQDGQTETDTPRQADRDRLTETDRPRQVSSRKGMVERDWLSRKDAVF